MKEHIYLLFECKEKPQKVKIVSFQRMRSMKVYNILSIYYEEFNRILLINSSYSLFNKLVI